MEIKLVLILTRVPLVSSPACAPYVFSGWVTCCSRLEGLSAMATNDCDAGRRECYNKRVLSIQSHVVHGYVGNDAAKFPLQVSFVPRPR